MMDLLASAISESGIALIIATATLLSLVHLRSSHLSDRARENTKDYVSLFISNEGNTESKKMESHKESIKWQTEIFVARYERMGKAFNLLVVALVAFMVAIVCCSSTSGDIKGFGVGFSVIAFGSLLVALFMAASEFRGGHKTLERHISIMR